MKPRPRRITTPATPPSRTRRFEPSPMVKIGNSRAARVFSRAARKCRRSSRSSGVNKSSARASGAKPGDRRERSVGLELAAQFGRKGAQRDEKVLRHEIIPFESG